MVSANLAPQPRRGFTLIELLVVIAIIAILAAILFPVFAQARAKARQTSCLSNLKQLNLGFMMYVQDYDENFPFWEWGQGYKSGTDPNNAQSLWINAIYPYVKNAPVYACPSDVSDLTPTNSQLFWWISVDPVKAGINPALVNQSMSYGIDELLEQGSLFGSYGTPTKLAAIPKPAQTFLIADMITLLSGGPNNPYNTGTPAGSGLPDPNNPKDPSHNCIIRRIAYANQGDGTWSGDCSTALPAWDSGSRHSAGAEIGYADGHVGFRRNSRVTNDLFRGDDSP